MAITTTITHQDERFKHKIVEGAIALDAAYAAGGEVITDLTSYIERANFVQFNSADCGQYILQWDVTNQKVIVKESFHDYTAISVNPVSALTDTIADLAVTVTGVTTNDEIEAIPPNTLEKGVRLVKAWVSAADTVTLRLANDTAGTVDAAAANWTIRARLATGAPRTVPTGTDLSTVLAAVRFRASGN